MGVRADARANAPYDELLVTARAAARAGAAAAASDFGHARAARRKADGTWVTAADEAAERAVREVIAESFPATNVLGEEEGLRRADGGSPHPRAPTWIVDPIDGTANYVAGIPIWATLVALVEDDRPVLGVVVAPLLAEEYEAAAGHGARFNGAPISVDPADRLADATVLYGGMRWFARTGLDRPLANTVARAQRDRGVGDFWGHVLVARGAAHAMIEAAPLSIWDVAALQPIVTEAGGVVTALDGTAWRPGSPALTSVPTLHAELVRRLAGAG